MKDVAKPLRNFYIKTLEIPCILVDMTERLCYNKNTA